MTPDLIDGIAFYLGERVPHDPRATALYNRLIVEVNAPDEPDKAPGHEGGSPGEDTISAPPTDDVIA